MGWFWNADIETARENEEGDILSETGYDGNRTYENSGTYGQNDYTVRERADGTFDIYVTSESDKGHSHDHIDSEGNILDHYHDYLIPREIPVNMLDLNKIDNMTATECQHEVEKLLSNSNSEIRLIRAKK